MKMLRACLFASCAFANHHASACLWDRDTLAVEIARFPGTAEIITGQFPRHSREFYEWRRKTAEEALSKNPNQLNLYDDLAVAQHKLGDHQGAVATMLKKDKIKPGLYETFSNLGTFYIYTGELDTAITWINKALAINPNAHFGRERYQAWLVQWLQERKTKGAAVNTESPQPFIPTGFARFVAIKLGEANRMSRFYEATKSAQQSGPQLNNRQRNEAIKGITGMMRFADYDNPALLEALGDLLMSGPKSGIQLATLAYLHAAQKTGDADKKKRLMALYKRASELPRTPEPVSDEILLENGLAKGTAHAEAVRADEMAWIAAGKDVSTEFEKKYLTRKGI